MTINQQIIGSFEVFQGDDQYTTYAVTPVIPAEGHKSGHRVVLAIAFTAPQEGS